MTSVTSEDHPSRPQLQVEESPVDEAPLIEQVRSFLPVGDLSSMYRNNTGELICIATGTEDGHPSVKSVGVSKASVSKVQCEICSQSWEPERMTQHIGAHILTSKWNAKVPPRFPCAHCGVREARPCSTHPSRHQCSDAQFISSANTEYINANT
jgi:hypothetical protein